jgi:hypothetical protein
MINNPNIRILICSEEFNTAKKFLSEITGHIETNVTFRSLYGNLKGKDKWSENEIIISTRTRARKEPTITCAGVDVTKVGLHYDLIIIDDPHSTKNITTREQIEKVKTWYRLVLSLLDPGCKLIVIGTRWHYDELFGWLKEKEREREEKGRKKRFHVLEKQSFRGTLKDLMNDKVTPDMLLWPERLDAEFLYDQLLDQGPYIFSCQYQNQPVDDESAIFKKSWIQFYDPNELPVEGLPTFATMDPIRDAEGNDFYAIIVCSMNANWIADIREVRRGKWDEYEAFEQIVDTCQTWNIRKFGIETVAWQKLFYRFLQAESLRRGIKIPIQELKTDTRITKAMRIRSMVPYWKSGLYRLPGTKVELLQGNMGILTDELLRYPRVAHEDCIDALAYMDQLLKRPQISRILKKIPERSFLGVKNKMRAKDPKKLGAFNVVGVE